MDALQARGVVAREVLLKNWLMRYYLFILLFFAGIFSGVSQNSIAKLLHKYNTGEIPYISVEALRMQQVKNEVLIIDARELEEYQVSHLKNAIFVGYDEFQLSNVKAIPKDQPLVVYCSLGIRSEDIAQKLQKAGYKNVQNLYGGIFEWKNNDFPVFDAEGNKTNKVHTYSRSWAKWLKNAEKIF